MRGLPLIYRRCSLGSRLRRLRKMEEQDGRII